MKSATLTIRIEPDIKEALRAASEAEHRSVANMVEFLIRGYCERHKIDISSSAADSSNGVRS